MEENFLPCVSQHRCYMAITHHFVHSIEKNGFHSRQSAYLDAVPRCSSANKFTTSCGVCIYRCGSDHPNFTISCWKTQLMHDDDDANDNDKINVNITATHIIHTFLPSNNESISSKTIAEIQQKNWMYCWISVAMRCVEVINRSWRKCVRRRCRSIVTIFHVETLECFNHYTIPQFVRVKKWRTTPNLPIRMWTEWGEWRNFDLP